MTAVYEICVEGCVDGSTLEFLDGMSLLYVDNRRTVLRGEVVDQAALHGLLARIRDMNLKLVYIQRKEIQRRVCP